MFASVAALIAISTRDDQPLPKEVENSVELSPLQSQRNRATQFDLKGRVELQTLKSLGAFKCQSTCTYGGDCIGNQKIRDIISARNLFWGTDPTPPIASERRESMRKILESSFSRADSSFLFSLNKKEPLCEWTLLVCLGIITDPNVTKSRQAVFTTLEKINNLLTDIVNLSSYMQF